MNTGLSDGTMTEVQGDEVKEGMEVIIGEQRQGADNSSDHQSLCAADDEKQPLTGAASNRRTAMRLGNRQCPGRRSKLWN